MERKKAEREKQREGRDLYYDVPWTPPAVPAQPGRERKWKRDGRDHGGGKELKCWGKKSQIFRAGGHEAGGVFSVLLKDLMSDVIGDQTRGLQEEGVICGQDKKKKNIKSADVSRAMQNDNGAGTKAVIVGLWEPNTKKKMRQNAARRFL